VVCLCEFQLLKKRMKDKAAMSQAPSHDTKHSQYDAPKWLDLSVFGTEMSIASPDISDVARHVYKANATSKHVPVTVTPILVLIFLHHLLSVDLCTVKPD